MRRKRRPVRRSALLQPVIALLTDFGSLDHYVGTMKGVILSINPEANIVDISHSVGPQNVAEGSYLLWATYPYFPRHTIFLCVVDPGVGTDRKIVCLETPLYQFVAPDNGLLDLVLANEKNSTAYEVTASPQLGSNPRSATFHGRDIFAPLVAHLSLGERAAGFGKNCVLRSRKKIFYDPKSDGLHGFVLHIDRFGNLITNVPGAFANGLVLRLGAVEVLRQIGNFSEGSEGQPCLMVGSSGLVEIVVRNGSAAKLLSASLGMEIEVLLGQMG